MLKKITFTALLCTGFWSCGNSNSTTDASTSNVVTTTNESAAAAVNAAYVPTQLTSNETQILFDALNPRVTWGTTQCFKRAHAWTHDMSILRNINPKLAEENPEFETKYNALRNSLQSRGINGINAMKVYIMFTNRLQMECDNTKDCKWFFHVAPYVMSDGNETVIDRGLFKSPLPIKTWAKNLTIMGYEKHTGRTVEECRMINTYTQYDDSNTLYRQTLATLNEQLQEYMSAEIIKLGRAGKASVDMQSGWRAVKMKIQRHEYTNDFLKSQNVPAELVTKYDSILSMDLCQLRKVPMFYYDPRSVEFADKKLDTPRTSWLEEDLDYAYDHFKEARDEY